MPPLRALLLLALLPLFAACADQAERDIEPDPDAFAVAPAATEGGILTPAPPDSATARAFGRIGDFAVNNRLQERPMGEAVQAIGQELLGVPYVEGLLDKEQDEVLVTGLTGFDCVLYVENVLALAQGVKAGQYDYATYALNIEDLRYRGGEMDGYCSRLHYFSEWISDNARRGNVLDVTRGLPGAVPYEETIDFMSGHRDSYPKLADDDLYACVEEVERRLAGRELYYVPEDRIAATYGELEAGDVIAITSSVGGLDIAHTGFVFKHGDGRTGFMHASTTGETVVVDDLASYVQGNGGQTGIMVARPVTPPPGAGVGAAGGIGEGLGPEDVPAADAPLDASQQMDGEDGANR